MNVDGIFYAPLRLSLSQQYIIDMFTLLVLLVLAGFPLARRLDRDLGAFVLAPLLSMTALVLVAPLPIPFSRLTITGVLLVGAAFNVTLLLRRPRRWVELAPLSWLVFPLLALPFLFAHRLPIAFMHYDYFHANMRSLDLARSGSVLSEWMANFDASGWYLIDQSTSIVLDAVEIIWAGADTGTLSRLYTILLACYVAILAGRTTKFGLFAPALAMVFALFVMDNAYAFRPHIYIGLALAALTFLLARPSTNPWTAGFFVIVIVLAKRDGLVLAPAALVLLLLAAYRDQLWTHRWRVAFGALLAAGTVILGLSYAQIGNMAVGSQFLRSVAALDPILLIARREMAFAVAAIAIAIAMVLSLPDRAARRRLAMSLLLGLATAALVLGSAILLDGGNRYNQGTIDRKLLYMLAPSLLALCVAAAALRPAVTGRQRRNPTMVLAVAGVLMTAYVGYQLRDIRSPHHAWGKPAVEAVAFFRSVVTPFSGLSIGVLAAEHEDIARTPFGDVDAYEFPYMTAYLGRDFRFGRTMDELADRDVIYLPRRMPVADRARILAENGRTYRELEGGLGLALRQNAASHLGQYVLARRDGSPIDRPLARTKWNDLDKTLLSDVRIAEVAWPGNVTQVMLAWPLEPESWQYAAMFEMPNRSGGYVHRVEFRDHPLGDNTPRRIVILTKEKVTSAPAQAYFEHGRYVLPVETNGRYFISFFADEREISPFWQAPHFVIFDLEELGYPPR